MNTDSRPNRAVDVVGRIINSGDPEIFEAVLVMPKIGQVKVLNEVGARIWELTDGVRSVADIANYISEEYDISKENALRDALEFLHELQEKGIITLI